MAFPTNPSPGDSYTDEYGTVWVYAGTVNGWYRQEVSTPNDTSYTAAISGPAGSNTQVQFNDNGELAGDSGLTYNKTTDALSGGAFIPTGSTVPTNGLYRPSANNVAISTNGTGRLFVDASGNVGFGGVPGNVAGYHTLRQIGSSGSTFEQYIGATLSGSITTDSQLTINALTAIPISIKTNNLERLRITSDGKLGLGTSSPGSIFEISQANGGDIQITNPTNYGSSPGTNPSSRVSNGISWQGDGQTGFGSAFTLVETNYIRSVLEDLTIGNSSVQGRYGLAFGTAPGGSGAAPATERMRIDYAGRVGVGTTSPSTTLSIGASASSSYDGGVCLNRGPSDYNFYEASDGTNSVIFGLDYTITVAKIGSVNSYPIGFFTGNGERARIDTSGRLLVGTSSARDKFFNTTYTPQFQLEGVGQQQSFFSLTNSIADNGGPVIGLSKQRSGSIGGNTIVNSGDTVGQIDFFGSDGTEMVALAEISASVDGTPGANDMPGRLVFSTCADGSSSPTERMRISNTGVIATFASTGDSLNIYNANGAGTSTGLIYGLHSATTNASGGTICFIVYTNGNVVNTNNSYGAYSDIKLKENIVDAKSQWADIKALRPVNYNFKEGQTHTQLGLIAQEVELVSPGLVSESPDRDAEGNDLGTVTKSVNYSVLYMKAVKALQEAMERIETLEAKVAALESA